MLKTRCLLIFLSVLLSAALALTMIPFMVTTASAAKFTEPMVFAADYHTLALRDDGTVWGWGLNSYGKLGNGEVGASLTPYPPRQVMSD
jgi:hypothetical protein